MSHEWVRYPNYMVKGHLWRCDKCNSTNNTTAEMKLSTVYEVHPNKPDDNVFVLSPSYSYMTCEELQAARIMES